MCKITYSEVLKTRKQPVTFTWHLLYFRGFNCFSDLHFTYLVRLVDHFRRLLREKIVFRFGKIVLHAWSFILGTYLNNRRQCRCLRLFTWLLRKHAKRLSRLLNTSHNLL